jgi:hypothetical protein
LAQATACTTFHTAPLAQSQARRRAVVERVRRTEAAEEEGVEVTRFKNRLFDPDQDRRWRHAVISARLAT